MIRNVGALVIVGSLWAGLSVAQSMQDLAQDAISGSGDISSILSTGTLLDTVAPYETDSPDEVDLRPTDFDDQEVLIQQSDSIAGRAFSAQADSFAYRPEIDLGNDPLALADDAIEQSEAVAGGLFESSGGECSATFDGGIYSGQQFCSRILARDQRQCYDTRVITVDRRDTWSCGIEGTEYGKKCRKDVVYACTGTTGAVCRKQLITFPNRISSWNSGGTRATVRIPDNDTASCRIKTTNYYIRRNDKVQLTTLLLRNMSFNGAAQILIDDVAIATFNTVGTFMPEVSYVLGPENVVTVRRRKLEMVDGVVLAPSLDFYGPYFTSFLGFCNSTRHTSSLNIDLSSYLPNRALATAVVVDNALIRPGGSPNDTLKLTVVRANKVEGNTYVRHTFGGACCSRLSVTDGGSC